MLLTVFQNPFLNWLGTPPGAMIAVLILATTTALISVGLTKWLVDTDEINRKQIQMKAHNEEKEKIIALAEVDPERYRKFRKKWERKDEMFKQSQQKMALQRLKPTCITFLPMIIIFGIVNTFFGSMPVALTPMNANDIPFIGGILAAYTGEPLPWTEAFYGVAIKILPSYGWIGFTAWYFLCSLGINTLIQRIFKLQTQASGGMGQMMGGGKAKALEFPDV
ncbi:MAG: EMC3/TMCO1 family protein [Candidatus Hermodarchaeota archaeon]